jgi:hypothetical protein
MSNSVLTGIQTSYGYDGTEGISHQTFLGASIRSFQTSVGFGDTTSTLNLDLVSDEYNTSDGFGLGLGVDTYHNGVADAFNPPNVGSPVFFKMGANPISVKDSWTRTYHDLYGTSAAPEFSSFNFGGILQDVNQTRGSDGNPLYSASISDPREILSNCVLILNNYAGTTYNNKNLFNVYGFLEYDPSATLTAALDSAAIAKTILNRTPSGGYTGDDTYEFPVAAFSITAMPPSFPITGRGFSRRTEQGIPWYRIQPAMKALLNYDGALPAEYINAGFGGVVDFRGFKYVIDFSGIPLHLIPQMYFIDYDQIDLFSLLQELCEAISHQMIISLLPVIYHSATSWLYEYNHHQLTLGNTGDMIAGIIRIDTIDQSVQPSYGAVEVESENLGYELSNVTTDKFVAGAQEVGMYAFTNNKDRDHLEVRKYKAGLSNYLESKMGDQWELDTALKQQILPFYGFLGKDALSIPKGWGPYQQILLDASALKAFGVGAYYVATEIELRHASMSYQQWMFFLRRMNEAWMKKARTGWGSFSTFHNGQVGNADTPTTDGWYNVGDKYAVHVPRCVFDSDKPTLGTDGLPESPCSPPYGYPLYYKRLEKIGLAVGSHDIISKTATSKTLLTNIRSSVRNGTDLTKEQIITLKKYNLYSHRVDTWMRNVDVAVDKYSASMKDLQDFREKAEYNTRKVYDFVKNIADKHLGKSFLVKIPKHANLDFFEQTTVNTTTNEVLSGPFGFRPDELGKVAPATSSPSRYTNFLDFDISQYDDGALKVNYNPINSLWEFNYLPDTEGGYFSSSVHNQVALEMLAPKDSSNFSVNGRWSCYVRFDHSQNLDLSSVGAENIAQEKISVDGSVPDILEELDNVKGDAGGIPSASKLEGYTHGTGDKYSAFVKCTVDPKLYMTPKVVRESVVVHARNALLMPNYGDIKTKNKITSYAPEKILIPWDTYVNPESPVISKFKRYHDAESQSEIIDTSDENLDSDHVYAIVNIPGRVVPLKAYRFVNISKTATNGLDYINDEMYNRGVVFGPVGFDRPPPMKEVFPEHEVLRAKAIQKASTPEAAVNFSSPSPVYPDIVVLPLMSTERCYGPWLSSTFVPTEVDTRIRELDIGGKIEFTKDEQLAPWNYAGYELMNEAGQMRAEFSNSLLLFAEKGSFTVPGLPLDMSLGQALIASGPLVTSINVNVGKEVKTTVQMDMFSASFGKLKEQQEASISKLARDRQKTQDLANKLSRESNKRNVSAASRQTQFVDRVHATSLQTGNTVYDVFVSTSVRREEKRIKIKEGMGPALGGGDDIENINDVDYYNSSALQSRGYLDEVLTVSPEANDNRAMSKNSGGAHLSHMFSPYDELPYNRNMPSMPYVHTKAIQQRTS